MLRAQPLHEDVRMAADPFHLAWFLQGSSIQAWGEQWSGNISEEWMSADMFLDLARSIERACFDYLLIEDSIYIGQNWEDSRDIFLQERHVRAAAGAVGRRVADDGGDVAPGDRADAVHLRLPPLPDGADRGHAGPGVRRPGGLEHGDRQLRPVGAEFRAGAAAGARHPLRHGRRIHRCGDQAVGFVGAGCHRGRPPDGHADRPGEGAHRSTTRASTTPAAAR